VTPKFSTLFKGGYAEVTLMIWHCEKTGVPMKARVDYLKIKRDGRSEERSATSASAPSSRPSASRLQAGTTTFSRASTRRVRKCCAS
jgi:hypothetical protein